MLPDARTALIKYRLKAAHERLAGVISYFQREYIKTGKIDSRFSKYISQAFQIRNNVDYADFFIVSQEDAREQFLRAQELCCALEAYLNSELSQ